MKSNGKSKSTFRLLNRKVLRSLKDNYKQYLAILMISFLAVCLFNGLTSNADLLNRRVENLYEKGNIADLFLTISPYSYQDDIIEIKDLDSNISEINARGNIQANYQQSSLNLLINNDDNTVSVPIVIDGNENFMITDSFAETNNLKIGDEMLLEITNPLLQSEEFEKYINLLPLVLKPNQENVLAEPLIQISFTISGIMYFPEAVASSQFSDTYIYSQFSYVYDVLKDYILSHYKLESYINIVSSQQIYNLLVNQILIKTSDIERSKDIINEYYASKETNNLLLLIDLENLPSNSQVMQDVNQSKKLTYVFPTIFFLVSILIISTTLSQLILKERLQIGAMKSLGIKKSLIYLHYMTYGFIVCLLGGLIGFIVGPLTLPKVMELKYALLWDMPQLSSKLFLPLNIVSILVILAIALLISFIVIRKSVSEKPVDLLKNVAPKTKVNLFNNARHLSLTTKMSFRNILANKAKSLMIILGTLGCTALLVCGFGIMDTLNYGVNLDIYENTTIPLTVETSVSYNNITSQLEEIDGVSDVEGLIVYPVTLTNNDKASMTTINLLNTANSKYIHFPYSDGVAIISTLADDLNVKVGDEISVTYNQKTYTRKIGCIVESSILNGIYDLSENYDSFIAPNTYYMSYQEDKLPQIEEEISSISDVTSVMTLQDLKDKADNLLSSIKMMTNVIKIFAIALAVVVIYNLISLNISERSRDIATMKVIGFHFTEIRSMLIKEIMILTFIGTFIGLFVGYPLCVLTLAINKTNLIAFLYHINFTTYLISLAISLVSALVVELILTIRINKISMVSSLKSVE